MRTRIALGTAVAVILIPVVLLLTIFSGSPSASVVSTRHLAMSQHRASTRAVRSTSESRAEKASETEQTAKLAAFYQAINTQQLASFYQAINTQQLAGFYNAINTQQLAAWYNAVNNSQLAAWYNAVNASEQHAAAAAQAAAAAPAPAPAASGGGWSGPWACIAQHESGGNPATSTGNGFYGGLQFTMSTWQANGGTGNPANASIAEQEAVANNVLASQGWGAWPNTSAACGL